MSWQIPKMWDGGEVWIIGGGPSMPRQFGVPPDIIEKVWNKELKMDAFSPFLSPVHNKHVIGVNMAFRLGTWIDVAFFGDGGFYFNNIHDINAFPKLRITCNPNLHKKKAPGVKYVHRDGRVPIGITVRPHFVSWNRNTGAAAINLATQFGATLIFLLGFDMTLDKNSRQHWHSGYKSANKDNKDPRKLPFNRHLPCFPKIKQDAKRLGITIINVNPKSKINAFPKMTLEEALNYGTKRTNT